MSNSLKGMIAAAVIAMGVTQAYAAQLVPAGDVLVDARPATGTITVRPGSQVTVRAGSARIYHENGCEQVVPAYTSEIVQADPVCNTGTTGYDQMNGPLVVVGTGIVVGIAAYQLSKNDDPVSP